MAPLEMNAGTCWGKNTIGPRGRSVEKALGSDFNFFLSATMNVLKLLKVVGYGKFGCYFGHCLLSLSLRRFLEIGSVCVIINTVLMQLGSTERAGLL
jgi:hypothetical protein